MSVDQGIGLVSIVVGVVLGAAALVAGIFTVGKRLSQRQKAGANSRQYQAGRDVHVGQ